METAYLVLSVVALAISIAFGKYFAFKYRQSEGKDRRNDRQVRLHGDGNFVSSIFNSVMQFIWGLLTVLSFLCALGAGFVVFVQVGQTSKSKASQAQIATQTPTAEVKKEEASESKPVIEAPQLEEQKNQANESGKTSESQEQNNLGEKDEARK